MRVDTGPLVALQLQSLQFVKMTTLPEPVWITTRQQWNALRPFITKLHEEENLGHEDILERVRAEKMFKATIGMLKSKLDEWGLARKFKKGEVEKILTVKSARDALGQETDFFRNGKKVDMAKLEKYRRRKHMEIPVESLAALDLEKSEELSWETPAASPISESADLAPTPSSNSSLELLPRLPRSPSQPIGLLNHQAALQDISLMFQAFVTSNMWGLSNSKEMPWTPTAYGPVKRPAIPVWHWQDECLTHLNNGITVANKGNGINAFKEWKEAFSIMPSVVTTLHYNTIGKMLSCIHLLEEQGPKGLSRQFRHALVQHASECLPSGHPYQAIFARLTRVETDCIENVRELQMRTQEFLVEQLDAHLGKDAFTSFEHRMVLNEMKLVKDKDLAIDSLIPTNDECCRDFGPDSSKTMLALNMRIGILKHRGLHDEAYNTCLQVIQNAETVNHPAVRGWHLASAWIALGRLLSHPSQQKAQVLSLENAWLAERELREKHKIVKLGAGDMNWIASIIGLEPLYSASGNPGLESMPLS